MMSLLQSVQHAIQQQQWAEIAPLVQQVINDLPESEWVEALCRISGSLSAAKRWEDALKYYHEALKLAREEVDIMRINGWIAETLGALQRYEAAKPFAAQSLAMRSALAQRFAPKKHLVSFSLYGSLPAYCETLILNAQAMPQIYPDWTMRVYHDDSVPQHVLARLRSLNVQCVHAADVQAEHMAGTFWRFLALADWDYDAVIMRDADSLITPREQKLVAEWLASGKPFHIIRDWFGHTDLILAGLWGARGGFLGDIRQRIDHYLANTPEIHPTHADQMFLAEHVWARILPYSVHHSSVIDFPDATWLDELPPYHRTASGDLMQLGSWQLSRYAPTVHRPYTLLLAHPDDRVFAEYHFQAGEAFELPRSYREAIESGFIKLHVIPKAAD